MGDKARRLKLKKLDALYIIHNPLDCLIIYFCICFTFIRAVYDIYELANVKDVYFFAFFFTVGMGLIMGLWARRAFKRLDLKNVV